MDKKTKIVFIFLLFLSMIIFSTLAAKQLNIINFDTTFTQPGDDTSNTHSQQENDENSQQSGDNSKPPSTTPKDSDGDGYSDNVDEFPYNSQEWKDSDNDGYGDNSDAFPYDSSEWKDTDGDRHGDNSDAFPSNPQEWSDSDHDRHGDNSDAFPYDASEWADSDGDGRGDNSDPYPYDYDNDGYSDSVDIMKNGDAAIKISLSQFIVVDQLDFLFTSVEVYFEIYIEGRMEARIDNNGVSWGATVGQPYTVNDWIVYNINDDKRYTSVSIIMWDDDFPLENDYIDIDGQNSNSKRLDLTFDAVTGAWTGDDNDGYTDGSDDGTMSSDDDDGVLWYSISIVEVEYDKTYDWSFNWRQWSLHENIPQELYASYKHSSSDRAPYYSSERAAYVTSNDPVIVEIGEKLTSLATGQDYDYYTTVNFVLRFVQSLEYTYDNATTPSNEYWRYAVETLVDETGDCEDTSVLFASLMEAMGYDAVLIDLPGHIAVGILGSEGYSGTYYIYNGQRYYYCETTGDGWTMGQIPHSFQGVTATIIQVS